MLSIAIGAVSFNGPSVMLAKSARAPAVSMQAPEHNFVYKSLGAPTGFGESMEESFVYKSAAGAADPLGDGKGNEGHVRQRGRAASSVQGAQPNFVYKSLGCPTGFGQSMEDQFVY